MIGSPPPEPPPPSPAPEDTLRRRAADDLRLPAAFLLFEGILSALGLAFCMVVFVLYARGDMGTDGPGGRRLDPMAVVAFGGMFMLFGAMSVAMITGARSMQRLSDWRSARTGAWCGALAVWLSILGVSVGIWNLVMLSRPHVRAAFESERGRFSVAGAAPQPVVAPSASGPLPGPVGTPVTYSVVERPDPGAVLTLPGSFLMAVSILQALTGLFMALAAWIDPRALDGPETGTHHGSPMLSTVLGLGIAALSLLGAAGALAMIRRRWYPLALAGAIVTLVQCWCLASLPVAIWSIVVLCRSEVRAAFPKQ